MANPLLSAMALNNMSSFRDIYSLYKSGGNPMALLNNMAKTNPQLSNVMKAIQQGANPQQLFYSLCQQRGIDPNTILSQFR